MDRKSFLNRNAALITFMVSAFWHGFYPTYYIMFYMAFLVEQVFDMLDKKTGYIKWLDRRFTSGGVVDYLGVFCFNMLHLNVLNYAAGIFCLVTWESSIVFMRNTYFFWLIGLHVVFGLVKYGLKATKDKKPE